MERFCAVLVRQSRRKIQLSLVLLGLVAPPLNTVQLPLPRYAVRRVTFVRMELAFRNNNVLIRVPIAVAEVALLLLKHVQHTTMVTLVVVLVAGHLVCVVHLSAPEERLAK